MQGEATVKLNSNLRPRGRLASWQPWGLLCQWGLAAGGRGHFKIRGAFLTAPPYAWRMCWFCCIFAYFPWVAEQTRCPNSGRKALWKWKSKSLLIGNTWFANHNTSGRERIWETPECQSRGDRPKLRSSSERLEHLPKDIWDENQAFWPRENILSVFHCALYKDVAEWALLLISTKTWASEWTAPSSICLSVKWGQCHHFSYLIG